MSKKQTGKLWVIEGIDGAGTTTQAKRLAGLLCDNGRPAIYTNQPSDGPIGNLIRQVLKGRLVRNTEDGHSLPLDPDTMTLLFSADRLDHVHNIILPHLEKGMDVVCDRYYYSTMAYQGVGGDMKWIKEANSRAPEPEKVFFLDITAKAALERVTKRNASGREGSTEREIYEKTGFLDKVVRNYRKIFKQIDDRVLKIDGKKNADAIASQISEYVLQAVDRKKAK